MVQNFQPFLMMANTSPVFLEVSRLALSYNIHRLCHTYSYPASNRCVKKYSNSFDLRACHAPTSLLKNCFKVLSILVSVKKITRVSTESPAVWPQCQHLKTYGNWQFKAHAFHCFGNEMVWHASSVSFAKYISK